MVRSSEFKCFYILREPLHKKGLSLDKLKFRAWFKFNTTFNSMGIFFFSFGLKAIKMENKTKVLSVQLGKTVVECHHQLFQNERPT